MSKAAKLIYSKFLLIPCICSSSFWHDCSIVAVHPTLKWSDATILVLKQLWGSHRCQSTLAPQLCKHWQHQVRLPSGWVSFTGIQECRLRPTLRSSFPVKINSASSWPYFLCFFHSPCALPEITIHLIISLPLIPSSQNPSLFCPHLPLLQDLTQMLFSMMFSWFCLPLVPILPLTIPTPSRWSCPCSSNLQGTCSVLRR